MTEPADAPPDEDAAGGPFVDSDLRWAWIVGVVAALAVVGPGLAPGAWLNVDLVVTPVTPVPHGVWAMGPELPRRVPFMVPFAWLSGVLPGELPLKLAVVAALASTVAGTWRLVRRWDPEAPVVARLAAGLLVGVGPFAVTRAGVGHLGLTCALALLPWALPALLRPLERLEVTTGWCLVLGLCGPFGGTFALPAVAVGLLAGPTRAGWRAGGRALGLAVAAQATWLVPTALVAALGTSIGSPGDFLTDDGGEGGVLRVLAGHGFWLEDSQMGRDQGWAVPVAGLVLTGLALVGIRRIPRPLRRPAAVLAALGLLGAVASALPVLDQVFAWTTERSILVAVREGQRLLALYLVVAVPAAVLGAVELARRARGWAEGEPSGENGARAARRRWRRRQERTSTEALRSEAPAEEDAKGRAHSLGLLLGDVVVALPLAAAAVLVLPGLWGAGGGLDPITLPEGWAEVRAEVRAHPGTVLVVPWSTYPVLPLDGLRRRVLNPMPIYLGGDVIVSSDPGFEDGSRERADPREPRAEELARRIAEGEDVGPELAALGVRWVVGLEVGGRDLGASMEGPGLRPVVETEKITLHEVPGWAAARGPAGRPAEVERPVAPIIWTGPGPVRVAAPGAAGWWRGGRWARTVDGLLELPEGSGPAVYPAAAAAGAGDLVALGLAVWVWRRRRTRRVRTRTQGGG